MASRRPHELTRFRRARWGSLLGYAVILLGIQPFALSWWNGFARETLGRLLTVEQLHVVEYLGLGWMAWGCARTMVRPRSRLRLVVVLAAVGLCDELVQLWLPQRVFEWSDVLLNWTGSMLGVMAGGLLTWVQGSLP